LPAEDGLPRVEITASDAPEAHIYTGAGHYIATTTQAGMTDLMQLHSAAAGMKPSCEPALQDIVSLYIRNRVKQLDNEKQVIEVSSHRWQVCPQLLSAIVSACNTQFE
jgi:hypothetical protein